MFVIWSRLKLFSQKKNIESMISQYIDFDSAPRSSNGLKIIFSVSLFSVQQLPNIMPLIKCVQCEHIVDLPLFVPTCFLLQTATRVDAV